MDWKRIESIAKKGFREMKEDSDRQAFFDTIGELLWAYMVENAEYCHELEKGLRDGHPNRETKEVTTEDIDNMMQTLASYRDDFVQWVEPEPINYAI